MSELPYPEMEDCAHVDYFSTPLPRLLFDQHDMIVDLEERLHAAEMAVLRYDEGIRCLQWLCSGEGEARMELYPAQLSELAIFGRTGRTPEWIVEGRKQLGR